MVKSHGGWENVDKFATYWTQEMEGKLSAFSLHADALALLNAKD
jgi:hypothetical protein